MTEVDGLWKEEMEEGESRDSAIRRRPGIVLRDNKDHRSRDRRVETQCKMSRGAYFRLRMMAFGKRLSDRDKKREWSKVRKMRENNSFSPLPQRTARQTRMRDGVKETEMKG